MSDDKFATVAVRVYFASLALAIPGGVIGVTGLALVLGGQTLPGNLLAATGLVLITPFLMFMGLFHGAVAWLWLLRFKEIIAARVVEEAITIHRCDDYVAPSRPLIETGNPYQSPAPI